MKLKKIGEKTDEEITAYLKEQQIALKNWYKENKKTEIPEAVQKRFNEFKEFFKEEHKLKWGLINYDSQ